MYRFEHDPENQLFAAALSGGGDLNDDFGTHIAELRKAGQAAKGKQRLAIVVAMQPGHPVPTAAWRSKVATMMTSGDVVGDLAVLSSNPVIRGVLTAVSWVISGDNMTFKMFPSWEAAEVWLTGIRGGSVDPLGEMAKRVAGEGRTSKRAG